MKLFLVLALAKYVNADARSEGRTLKDLLAPTFIAALPAALIVLQPDLGTALILGLIFISIIAMLRIQRRTLGHLAVIAAIAVPTFMSFGMLGFQQKRIEAWLNPDRDIGGINWDPHHSRIAIGAGKAWGAGFMQGTQNQFRFLHEQHSDFPFPVFAEDWGFVGALLLVFIYVLLVLWSIHIAASAKDRFGAALAIGSGSLIFWHAIFNLGMVTGLLPIVGVTLPLFSYGGSSGLTVMVAIALLMNVSMRRSSLSTITFSGR
jgi:rod shape determining protein RodA